MTSHKVVVTKTEEGKRLDIALSIILKQYSRTIVKKAIEENKVTINKELEYRANYKVKSGDIIEIDINEQDIVEKIIPEDIDLEIIYEDDDLIAINKPAGLVVHPATGNWSGTVMNALMYHNRNLENVGESIRSGLIHRLDKDTSGILLIGKTNKGLWHYSKLFSTRNVEKIYVAVTSGAMPQVLRLNKELEVKNYIARNKGNRKKMAVVAELTSGNSPLPNDVRIAQTNFELIDTNTKEHVYLARPKTGRTHQIRVHCNHIGTPIIGDKTYGGISAPRMLLHAYKIIVITPEGKNLEIVAKPDNEFIRDVHSHGLKLKFK